MTIEHDFLLSAYFDGHGDPDQRRRAEAILASDPAAAEALRSLAGVRDLVAGLSRPRGPDVSGLVLNRIVGDAGRPRRWKTWGPYVGRGFGASAVAASLGLIVFLGLEPHRRGLYDPPSARVVPQPSETLVAQLPAQPAVAERAEPKAVNSVPAPPVAQAPAPAEPVVTIVEPQKPGRDQPPGFQELWKTAGPRRDFVVTSAPDESTAAAVATLLGQSTHHDFYRVVVPGGSGDSPRDGSNSVVAFAARLDPSEFATLRGRLTSEFQRRVATSDPEPEVAALLAEVGQVTAAPPTPAAEVSFPHTQHAFRIHSNSQSDHGAEGDAATDPPDDDYASPTPADPTSPSVVLIWVVGPAPK